MEEPTLYNFVDKSLYRLDTDGVTGLISENTEINPESIASGALVSTIVQNMGNLASGKATFTNDEDGYILGLDEGVAKFYIGSASKYLNVTESSIVISGLSLMASSLDIPDTTTANSFHVNTSGDTWWGATAIGSAVAKVLKTGVATFTDIIATGTISGRSTATIASAINASGNLITNVINTNLDTSAKTILGDFTFSPSDYSGAFKTGDITWNTTTGAIISGSGGIFNKKGLIFANAGVATITLDGTTGNATFAGTLSGVSGTFGTITAGTLTGCTFQTATGIGERMVMSSADNSLKFYDSDNAEIIHFGPISGGYHAMISAKAVASSGLLITAELENTAPGSLLHLRKYGDIATDTSPALLITVDPTDLSIAKAMDISYSGAGPNAVRILNLAAGASNALYISNEDDTNTGPTAVFAHAGVVGEIVALQLGGNLDFNNEGSILNQRVSKVRAYRATSAQSIPDATWTKVELNAESYDTLGEFDKTTNFRFTATKVGYHMVIGSVYFPSLSDGVQIYSSIRKNGAEATSASVRQGSAGDITAKASDIIYLDVGDYLELWVYQGAGAAKDLPANSANTFMSINKLS